MSASGAPPLSLSSSASAFFCRRSPIWSSRQRASTRSFTSSSERSFDGVIAATSNQRYPDSPNRSALASTPTAVANAGVSTSTSVGSPDTGDPLGSRPERSTASITVAVRPTFCAASVRLAPPARSSSIASCFLLSSSRARDPGEGLLDLGHDLVERLCLVGLDLDHPDQRRAEPRLHRAADAALRERERSLRHRRRPGKRRARHETEIDVLLAQAAGLGDLLERRAGVDALLGGLRLVGGREDDLLDLPASRRDVSRAVFVS